MLVVRENWEWGGRRSLGGMMIIDPGVKFET